MKFTFFISIFSLVVFICSLNSVANTTELSSQQNLNGEWETDLGAVAVLQFNDDGTLTGQYKTVVGVVPRSEPLVGRWFVTNLKPTILAGFMVEWTHGQLTENQAFTSWAGQIIFLDNKPPMFNTTWASITNYPEEDKWKRTSIGQNDFILREKK